MALLDAVPIGSTYHRSMQPVANDLVFLTDQGVRNIGIAGASTNLQAGDFGKAIDPLVIAAIAELEQGDSPLGLYVPALGQYWLFFAEQAFVLTINGGAKDMSWSRYVFPEAITDWTIRDNDLLLRTETGKVWRVSDEALEDDIHCSPPPEIVFKSGLGEGLRGWNSEPESPAGELISSNTEAASGVYSSPSGAGYWFRVELKSDAEIPEDPPFDEVHVFEGPDFSGEPRVFTATAIVSSSTGYFPVEGVWRRSWRWNTPDENFFEGHDGDVFSVRLVHAEGGSCSGVPFTGVIHWPHLDLGSLGVDKQLFGFDLVCTAPEGVSVSVGYDQRNINERTPDYAVDADTLPGQVIAMPVTAPSFDLRLTFAPGQQWEWMAANLYIQDLRRGP
jgi:hypothetical protein